MYGFDTKGRMLYVHFCGKMLLIWTHAAPQGIKGPRSPILRVYTYLTQVESGVHKVNISSAGSEGEVSFCFVLTAKHGFSLGQN